MTISESSSHLHYHSTGHSTTTTTTTTTTMSQSSSSRTADADSQSVAEIACKAPTKAEAAVALLYGTDGGSNVEFSDLFGDGDMDCNKVEKVFETFGDPHPITVGWFDDKHQRNIVKHELNDKVRASRTVNRRYVNRILKHGIVPGVRGEPWAVWGPNRTFPIRMITYGSLSNSFYTALEEVGEGKNAKVDATLQRGLTGVRMLHERTHACVLLKLKNYHNEFHGGQEFNLLERAESCLALKSKWDLFCQAEALKSSHPEYKQKYHAFIDEKGDDISFNLYSAIISFVHCLIEEHLWEDWKAWVSEYVDYLDPRLDVNKAFAVCHRMSFTCRSRVIESRYLKSRFVKDTGSRVTQWYNVVQCYNVTRLVLFVFSII